MRRQLVVLALGLALGACGGEGERLTKEEFIAQADAICAEAEERAEESLGDPQDLESFVNAGERAFEMSRELLQRLRSLRPPAQDQAIVDEWLDTGERAIDREEELMEPVLDAARRGDLAALEAAVDGLPEGGTPEEAEANEIARAYGLRECAEV